MLQLLIADAARPSKTGSRLWMWTMGKKSRQRKNQQRQAGGGLAGPLGHALQRLPTTVKADAPTLVLGRAASPPAKAAFRNPLQRFTRQLAQARRAPGTAWNDMRTVRKMKKLAHQMAKGNPSMSKKRRSRLPLVVALLALVVCAGGFYAYRNVKMPRVQVTRYLNPHKWLDAASGHKPVHAHHTTRHVASHKTAHTPRRHTRALATHHHSVHAAKHSKSTKHHGHLTTVAKHKKSRSHHAKLAKRKKHHGYSQTSYGR